jgi:dihydrofolate reductase
MEGIQVKKEKTRIIAIAAITIDGKIARHSGEFTDWTSPEDKDVLHHHLDKSDVIVVGNNTYKIAEAPLSKRNCIVFTRSVRATEQLRENLLFCNPEGVALSTILNKYRTVALLGGRQIYTYFLERDLIDEMYLTIEPIIFGNGLDLFDQKKDVTTKFELTSYKRLNKKGSILMHYERLTRVRI